MEGTIQHTAIILIVFDWKRNISMTAEDGSELLFEGWRPESSRKIIKAMRLSNAETGLCRILVLCNEERKNRTLISSPMLL
ncbi:hypothetical protein OROGR_010980 [Orobanche gracilis]